MAKVAQDKLVELEKANAPIDKQLEQAGLFAGIEWLDFLYTAVPTPAEENATKATNNFHGREEWALRWLIKKMQKPEARTSPIAWKLFRCLVERIPILPAAKILNERKVLTILRQALEETAKIQGDDSKEEGAKSSKSGSKKRRRSGELVENTVSDINTYDVAEAIYEAVDSFMRIVDLSDVPDKNDASDIAFAKKFMKLVVTTTEEEAATILNAWLRITVEESVVTAAANQQNWVAPFVQIWSTRIQTVNSDKLTFKKCLEPALSLLAQTTIAIPQQWRDEIEKLVSQCVILPAKTAYGATRERDTSVLSSVVQEVVAEKPTLSQPILDIAIRSTQITTNLRTRSHAINWLQAVFKVLMEAIPDESKREKNAALAWMLKTCHEENIPLDLELLRTIVSKHAFSSKKTDFKVVAAVIDVNPLTFTLSGAEGKASTAELFARITKTSSEKTKDEELRIQILTSLMRAFAKSRDLAGFIHGWYEQLVTVAASKLEVTTWDHTALLATLDEIMELSLTPVQVSELCLWLVTKSDVDDAGPGPALAIAVGVSGALKSAAYISQVGDSLWRLAFDSFDKVKQTRWEIGAWNTMAHCFNAASLSFASSKTMLDDVLSKKAFFDAPKESERAGVPFPDILMAWFRFAVSYHTFACEAAEGMRPHTPPREAESDMAPRIAEVLDDVFSSSQMSKFAKYGRGETNMVEDTPAVAYIPLYMWTIIQDYPYMQTLIANVSTEPAKLGKMVGNMFWMASLRLQIAHKTASTPRNVWKAMLMNGKVLNNKSLVRALIDIMIERSNLDKCKLEKSNSANGYAVECLAMLPIEVFGKQHREKILKSWVHEVPGSSADDNNSLMHKMHYLNPAIVSLKMKMMEKPNMAAVKADDLSELAFDISVSSAQPKLSLGAFSEYVKRIQGHLLSTLGQAKTDEFVQQHLEFAQIPLRSHEGSKIEVKAGTIQYVELALGWWAANEERLAGVISAKHDLSKTVKVQRKELVKNLTKLFEKPLKIGGDYDDVFMSAYFTLKALESPVFDVQSGELKDLWEQAHACAREIRDIAPQTASMIVSFFLLHNPGSGTEGVDLSSIWSDANEDPSTTDGRDTLRRAAQGYLAVSSESKIRQTAHEMIPSCVLHLDKLVFLRYLIMGVSDRANTDDETAAGVPDLASSYMTLLSNLTKVTDIRSFHLTTEIIALLLRTKSKSLTQHATESTVTTLSILLSKSSPSLPCSNPGSIYIHLVELMDAIFASHRLKLSGRTHLVAQVLIRFLNPLFAPLNTNKSWKEHAASWLCDPEHVLSAEHGEAFARLLTTIADPSASAVSRSSKNPLISATAKAKREAGAYLPYVLMAYVKLSLDMGVRMDTAVREKVKQGWWACFDAMGVEGRKVMGESMDRAGRDVLRSLVEEWVKFGKWKGN